LCHFGVYAVLFNLYLLRLGYDLKFVSTVNAAGQLSFAVASLSAGLIGQRWGNRRTMIIGICLVLTGYGLLPMIRFQLIALHSIWLTVTYILAWVGMATVIVNMIPFLMDATDLEERNYVFSMVGAVLSLSGFVGNLAAGSLPGFFARILGVSLNHPTPYRYPLLLAAVLVTPGLLAMLMTTRDGGSGRQQEAGVEASLNEAAPAPLGLIAMLMLVMLLTRTGEGAARTFFNVYLDAALQVPTALIATLSAVVQLLALPAALAAPVMITHLGLRRAIVLGNLFIACSLLPLALIARWEAVGLSLVGVIVMVSVTIPAFAVHHQEIMPPRWRTIMAGAATLARGLSWSSMTFAGGFMITNLGYRPFFLTGAALTATGGLLFWAYFRAPRGESVQASGLDTVAHNLPETGILGCL
jgi:MFS family permease